MATYVTPQDCVGAAAAPRRVIADSGDVENRGVQPVIVAPIVAGGAAERLPGAVASHQAERLRIAVLALAVVALVCWAISSTFGKDLGTAPPTPPVDGLTIFAVFFVATLAVERLLEPLSHAMLPKGVKALSAEDALRNAGLAVAAADDANDIGRDEAARKAVQGAADAGEALNVRHLARTIWFWAIATIIGMVAAATMKLDFLGTVGIDEAPPRQTILATGLIIGAGTKPLHDLIALISKKSATSD